MVRSKEIQIADNLAGSVGNVNLWKKTDCLLLLPVASYKFVEMKTEMIEEYFENFVVTEVFLALVAENYVVLVANFVEAVGIFDEFVENFFGVG